MTTGTRKPTSQGTTVLVVDDDPVQRRLLRHAVEEAGHTAILADGGEAAMVELARAGTKIGVVVLDLLMPDMDGLAVMGQMRERAITAPVVVQTGQGGIDTVVSAMRAGAFDFVVKPVSPKRLQSAIDAAMRLDRKEGSGRAGRGSAAGGFRDIVSASPAMERALELARRAAASTIPVVLEGESGVGKEMIARAIGGAGERRSKPFVTVNCGAIPENLVESVLFGHEKGAFTGAGERHPGKFTEADGGTLFLDEVGELPTGAQVKLLRAVQQGEIETVGAKRVTRVDCRIVSATNKDLIAEVKAGRFREDLYYRLAVFPILVPALRRRKEDVPPLVRHFVERFAGQQGVNPAPRVLPETMALLTAYDWPGNTRELENALYRAIVLGEGRALTPDLFPQIAAQLPAYDVREAGNTFRVVATAEPVHEDRAAPKRPAASRITFAEDEAHIADAPSVAPETEELLARTGEPEAGRGDAIPPLGPDGQVRPLAEIEEDAIRFALKFYDGQMSRVARRLGIGRSTLYRKLKEYAIDPADPEPERVA
ncbi:sigma-54-dependent transcriptional regulator [Pararhizobium mangrovi]|uniref:DNA-binding transcriptional regulator NtrC n=1 Tax=Pararhizobium mangrovi TaxID=2590452 RepID=A0A506U7W3_9HYPH|nr:sigma-54 dependent transcriptional regulator [Pararhizobium mangrovi]TPW29970.1 sigma-54-dependent Fis family transcriptional regulator [Pararhizobium mangrovi]